MMFITFWNAIGFESWNMENLSTTTACCVVLHWKIDYFVTVSESRQVLILATLLETQYSLNQIINKTLQPTVADYRDVYTGGKETPVTKHSGGEGEYISHDGIYQHI